MKKLTNRVDGGKGRAEQGRGCHLSREQRAESRELSTVDQLRKLQKNQNGRSSVTRSKNSTICFLLFSLVQQKKPITSLHFIIYYMLIFMIIMENLADKQEKSKGTTREKVCYPNEYREMGGVKSPCWRRGARARLLVGWW